MNDELTNMAGQRDKMKIFRIVIGVALCLLIPGILIVGSIHHEACSCSPTGNIADTRLALKGTNEGMDEQKHFHRGDWPILGTKCGGYCHSYLPDSRCTRNDPRNINDRKGLRCNGHN